MAIKGQPGPHGPVSERFMTHYYGARKGVDDPNPKVIVPVNPSAGRLLAGVKAFQHARATDNPLEDWHAAYIAMVTYKEKE